MSKKYTVYESKSYLIKLANNVSEENLRQYGEFDRNVYGKFPSTDLNDGKIVGKKLKSGIKSFYAFEES